VRETTTLILSGGDGAGGYWSGLIVPAVIFLLGAAFSAGILIATRRRQGLYDSEQEQEHEQLERDRNVLSKIYWLLDRDLSTTELEKTHDELLHYAWLLKHPSYRSLAQRIRDFDRSTLSESAKALAEFHRIKDEVKLHLS
jgi:hypothetical protein